MFDKSLAQKQTQHLIGTPYVYSVKEYISELTGYPRVVGPNEASTREFALDRILIAADADGIIATFSFA